MSQRCWERQQKYYGTDPINNKVKMRDPSDYIPMPKNTYFFRPKSEGFLADDKLDHNGEIFEYIQELHDLLHKIGDTLGIPTIEATKGWANKLKYITEIVENHKKLQRIEEIIKEDL